MSNNIKLDGCSPVPLAYYLKALGILRLVSEQKDQQAKGYWQNDRFVLQTSLNKDELINFFLNEYKPTPIVAPWNGGSGFYPKDNQEALTKLQQSKSKRFEEYKATITDIKSILDKYGLLNNKPEKENKERILAICRNELPDNFLKWFDAAVVLTDESPKFPPILGTGGIDGRLDFTNNFMQRLTEMIDPETGNPEKNSEKYLKTSLFSVNIPLPFQKAPIGQFLPGMAGGANSTRGFVAEPSINPWDYILMLEGTLFFASACVRRLNPEGSTTATSPFYVKTSPVAYASATISDAQSSRGEIWLPIWEKPASLQELVSIFSEGRAQVGRRLARNGLDFIRATVTLGVDRGISAFQRYGIQERNGLAYFAIPLDRIIVKRNVRADLLSELDHWLSKISSSLKLDTTPGSIVTAVNNLLNSIVDLCKNDDPEHLQEVLIQLGQCEKTLAKSILWTVEKGIRPLNSLSGEWIKYANTESREFRLACSLASISGKYGNEQIPIRCNLEPVNFKGPNHFEFNKEGSPRVVWSEGDIADVLNKIFSRRLIDAEKSGEGQLNDKSIVYASLDDINSFILGETDDKLILKLLWGLILIKWSEKYNDYPRPPASGARPNALYALMKLCFMKRPNSDEPIPLTPAIHRLASAGRCEDASRMAARRLLASDLPPAIETISLAPEKTRRVAAALLFPISERDWHRLAEAVLRPEEEQAK